MYDLSKPGHLLTFFKKEKKQRYYLYLYIRDVNVPTASLIVLPGIRKIIAGLPKEDRIELEIKPFSDVERITVETDIQEEEGIINAPIEIFADSQGNFKENLFKMCLENLLNDYKSIFPIRELGAVARNCSFVRYEENFKNVLENYISAGKNVVIDAPRRGGKTSFVKQLVKELKQKGYKAHYVDMEHARNPVQFSVILLMHLRNKPFKTELVKSKQESKLLKEINSNYRQEVEKKLLKLKGDKIILAMDECSMLLEEMLKNQKSTKELIKFLVWFKKVRENNKNLQFVFSGSIKFAVFNNILGQRKLFEDCEEYSLLPFDRQIAANLVEGLFFSEEIYPPEYVVEGILNLTTPYFPYFLQIVTDEMMKFYRSNKKFPERKEIRSIVDTEVIGTSCRRYLDQLLINLRRYNPRENIGARAVLNHLSLKGQERRDTLMVVYKNATGSEEGFEKTLALLEYDFYLEKKKNGDYRFNNEIIKKWWQINYADPGKMD